MVKARTPSSDGLQGSGGERKTVVSAAVARMSSVTTLSIMLAFVTSPLQARALGPSGRGDLAAITVVLGLAPTLLDFGLAGFVARERARGTHAGALYGTMLALTLPFCLIGVAAAVPVGHLIGHGRPVVTRFVELGLWLSPLTVAFQTMGLAAWAEQRWGLINRLRLTPPLATAVAFVALYAFGRLTVTSAAVVIIAAGLLSGAQLIPLLMRTRDYSLRPSLIRPGLSFGSRGWVTTVLAQGNNYLDQLMMTGLTSARQLGLYAVATTVSSVAVPIIVAPLVTGCFADVAKGQYDKIPAICRTGLLATLACDIALAGVGPVAIVLLFGRSFDGAITMVFLLLLSSLPASISGIVTALLGAAGRPGDALRAQAVGLAVSVPVLAVVLPRWGGIGASVTDNVTNAIVAGVALRYGTRIFGGQPSDYCRPRWTDALALYSGARAWLRGIGGWARHG